MKNWIARWFDRNDGKSHAAAGPMAPAAATVAAALSAPASAAASNVVPSTVIDTLYFRWLTGAGQAQAAPGAERQILAELARLAASPGAGAELVPRVPAVIPQLLRSLRDETLSGTELARQLAQDVVLVAEVIREANSPYYHPGMPVKSVETAVRLLGQNGLRMVIARVAFRPVISTQTGRHARQVAPQLWIQSEQCARAARQLAPAMHANAFEAYLAGLLHNVGLMVAFRLIDQIHPAGALPASEPFCASLFGQARLLSSRIGAQWEFPATVTAALAGADFGTDLGTDPGDALAATLAVGERISKLRALVDAGRLALDDALVEGGLDRAARACLGALDNHE